MGLLFRADKLTTAKPTRAGLLSHSLQYLNLNQSSPPEPNRQPAGTSGLHAVSQMLKPLIDDFNRNIRTISNPTDLIKYIAASYVKFLKIKSLACLMYDPINVCYTSWLNLGFANNFSQELNFPAEEIRSLLTSSTPVETGKSKLTALKKYLTKEDYAALEKVTLVPLLCSKQLTGFLLIADPTGSYCHNPQFMTLLNDYPSIPALLQKRCSKIEALNQLCFGSKEQLLAGMEKQLEYSLKNKTIFNILKLSLVKTISPVMEDDPKLNSHLLKEEVLLLLDQLFKHIGYLYNMQNGDVLFVINKLRKFDLTILVDQLLKTMQRYFSDIIIENDFELAFDVYAYPTEGETVESLLAKYYESDEHLP